MPIGPLADCMPAKLVPEVRDGEPSDQHATAETGPNSPACLEAVQNAQTAQLELDAQWRAAVAATNAVALAERQWRWSVLEFSALVGTLAIAYVSISDGRRHTTAELRAYLAIKERTLHRLHPGQKARVDFKITNSGATPAYKVRYRAALEVFPNPYIGDISREFAKDPNEVPPAFVVQSSESLEAEAIQYKPMKQVEYDAVMEGTKALYLVGEIEYEDTFGKERITRFCCWVGGPEFAEIDKSSRASGAKMSRVDWIYTIRHNEAN
ncbi:hypothetical protein [Brevundimonas sp. FT23028]|uniref:hypothetical protein n=1 Tax=Brevundimonas sp. FT23028 TaxID=3393748 RepID=UPI003B588189